MIIAIDSKLPTWLEANNVPYWHKVQSAQGSHKISAQKFKFVRQFLSKLTRTPRGLCGLRTGYAYQPPALGTYRTHRAACPQGPTYCTYAGYASQPRALRAYRVPWHPRCLLAAPWHGLQPWSATASQLVLGHVAAYVLPAEAALGGSP